MKMKKALLMVLCAVALVVSTVFGTLAYLTDDDAVTNTFTVGKGDIKLDEADVDNSTEGEDDRDQANKYHLLPGHEYDKDPTVTVLADSEESYVRMIMTVYNADAVQDIIDADDAEGAVNGGKGEIVDFSDLLIGWNENVWKYEKYEHDDTNDTITFEFRYHTTVTDESGQNHDGVLEPLFTKLKVPGYVTNEQLLALYGGDYDAENGAFVMDLKAHAIQAAGFDDAAAAWAEFTEN